MADGMAPDLNEIFQVKARLGIMTFVITSGPTDFSTLKQKLNLTDGNLGAHIRVLEDAGYIEVEKGFVGRRPRTLCRVTQLGREAFGCYLKQLEELIQLVRSKEP